jgi:hydrogenase nickel incorporation protein HypB
MCDTCGCNVTHGNRHLIAPGGKLEKLGQHGSAVSVLSNLLSENDHVAAHNREHFDRHGVLAVNLMSSPGAGKTALLEASLERVKQHYRVAVIEGDLETENDARRIRAQGVEAVQIVTGTACHLDAHMVHKALHQIDLDSIDILFIENVGNLVCPASFDLGQHRNVALLSVPEGDDKPSKYPVMFRAADLVAITKVDLLPVLDDFSVERARSNVRALANAAPLLELSTRRQDSLGAWLDWLEQQVAEHRSRCARGESLRPRVQPDGAVLHGLATSG